MKAESRVVTSVNLPVSLVERIDRLAGSEKRTRSNMIECLLLDALIEKAKGGQSSKIEK